MLYSLSYFLELIALFLMFFKSSFQETIPVTQLVRETATVMQEFTQSGYSHALKISFSLSAIAQKEKKSKQQKKRKKQKEFFLLLMIPLRERQK